jgi:hypothetical protein
VACGPYISIPIALLKAAGTSTRRSSIVTPVVAPPVTLITLVPEAGERTVVAAAGVAASSGPRPAPRSVKPASLASVIETPSV